MQACHEILDLISTALDVQLSEREQTMLNEHLNQCPACSALFDELQGLHTAAAQLEDIPAPEDFSNQVMARIAADPTQEKSDNVVAFPTKKSIYRPWKKWAVSAAALAIVILGAATLPGQFSMGGSAPAKDNLATADSVGKQVSPHNEDHTLNSLTGDPEKSYSHNSDSNQAVDSTYCGTLILSEDNLPEGLEQYNFTTNEEGNLVYIVPADYFFALKNKGFFPSVGSADLVFGPPDATTGRIIVKPST